jgi:hypothetical protein
MKQNVCTVGIDLAKKIQIPPDLVVKSQPVDIVDVICS